MKNNQRKTKKQKKNRNIKILMNIVIGYMILFTILMLFINSIIDKL